MGTDDLHHKRKAQQQLERKKPKSIKCLLIVCEDSQSSPAYFKAICNAFKLEKKVEIHGSKEFGSAPTSVVKHAKSEMKNYEHVYCVIDRDQHANFDQALDEARGNNIKTIVSIPCFEYWLLLHFEFVDQPFQAADGSSHCEQVISRLKKYLQDYEKTSDYLEKHYQNQLKPKQKKAEDRAKDREEKCENEKLKDRNPYTELHHLVKYLDELSKRRN